MSTHYYDQKINDLQKLISNQIAIQKKTPFLIYKENLLSIKNNFATCFSQVISDLHLIIEKVSIEQKEVEITSDVDNEESPASKITSLNLNWRPHNSDNIEFNRIIFKKNYTNGSYHCIRSEQILDKPFLGKITIDQMNCSAS